MTATAHEVDQALPGTLPQDLAAAALALARRFAHGGTLWCVAPSWPQHASHVAVEFVHPVVVGARALPAVAIAAEDAVASLRTNTRTGDVLLLTAPAHDPIAADLAQRSPAWGVSVLWLGCGAPPPAGAADHVLWLPDETDAPYDGRLVLLYHLLWELTHVCFEHPGLLAPDISGDGPVCVTCSDEGRLAEVRESKGTQALVRTATGLEKIDVALVGAVRPGELVLIHAGSALSKVAP